VSFDSGFLGKRVPHSTAASRADLAQDRSLNVFSPSAVRTLCVAFYFFHVVFYRSGTALRRSFDLSEKVFGFDLRAESLARNVPLRDL